MRNCRFIGLTGGIGSGKSTVRSIIADMGIPTLDLDLVGRELLITEPSLVHKLIEAFGEQILHSDHTVNRKLLAKLAFRDRESTIKLNAIMHPAIQAHEQSWRKQQTSPFACIEASVLIEAKSYSRMDALIVVIADMELRRERTLQRGNHDSAAFDSIVQRQCSDNERLKVADYIIYNNSSINHLTAETSKLIQHLKQIY